MTFPLLALLLACHSQAERYLHALEQKEWDGAKKACLSLPEGRAGDCLVAATSRLGRLEEEDCEAVEAPLWYEECRFQLAERLAAAGRVEEAFALCDETAFGRECGFHLVREAARHVIDGTVVQAAKALAPYADLPSIPDAPRLFWRAWFRERLAANRPVDPTGCRAEPCFVGAREAIFTSVAAWARSKGPEYCDAPVPPRDIWVEGTVADDWVAEWQEQDCRLRSAGPPGEGGPPKGPAPWSGEGGPRRRPPPPDEEPPVEADPLRPDPGDADLDPPMHRPRPPPEDEVDPG